MEVRALTTVLISNMSVMICADCVTFHRKVQLDLSSVAMTLFLDLDLVEVVPQILVRALGS